MYWIDIAKQMYFMNPANPDYDVCADLDYERLPHELWQRLYNIDNLCLIAGGTLRSRQVIAMVVAQYLKEFPYETTEN